MRWGKRPPISVWVVACLYMLVGIGGFVSHFPQLLAREPDSLWVELTELLAFLCAVFLLLGHNWARWLAVAWMAFHVAISFPVILQVAVHSVFLIVIAWLLFRPGVRWFFDGGSGRPGYSV